MSLPVDIAMINSRVIARNTDPKNVNDFWYVLARKIQILGGGALPLSSVSLDEPLDNEGILTVVA